MYVVRPEYFMIFLSLLASLAIKYASFMTAEKKDLLNKEDAIKMFEDFKNDVLVKSFASLSKSIDEMFKKAQSIQSSAEDIIDECRKIQDRTLERLKNKIEKVLNTTTSENSVSTPSYIREYYDVTNLVVKDMNSGNIYS